MQRNSWKGTLILLLAALIWGSAFVAQSESAKFVAPFTFNCTRSFIGSAVLIPVFLALDALRRRTGTYTPPTRAGKKRLWLGGAVCGTVLFVASNLQQMGIAAGTSPGKAGFITALYILIVPLAGLLFRRRVSWHLWPCIAVALGGLYLLCVTGGFRVQSSDLYVLACAIMFSCHILVTDYFAPRVDGVRLSSVQFLTCAVLSGIAMLLTEQPSLSAILNAGFPLLYAGVMSCGVAYTLQIIGQTYAAPTIGSLAMSMESVFAVLTGMLVLGQIPTVREAVGCGLMLVAIVAAQLPGKKRRKAL